MSDVYSNSVDFESRCSVPRPTLGCWVVFVGLMFSALGVHAQWITQSFTLKPGWNAIYSHVDASYTTLDALITDANGPVAEIWLWKPTFSTIQFIDSPYTSSVANSQWSVWTSARGDTDTLTAMVGNGAYLINNRTASAYVWSVKGKPVPPSYQWTTTGLNFLGFPTPSSSPPTFATYLTPAPALDLAMTLQNGAHVFRYIGGSLGSANPSEVVSVTASATPVERGQAFWVRGSTNYYNHYYGPVEVTLQSKNGIAYDDTLGTYGLILKNVTASLQTVSFTLLASETPPANQPSVYSLPQLLVRGSLSTTDLTYSHAVLNGQQFQLQPQGQVGSELPVVLGLNRTAMTGPSGSLYAGVLRITDSSGLQQIDMSVSATVPNTSGLWVGEASVSQVGQYLKSYPKINTATDETDQINTVAAAANLPRVGVEIPGSNLIPREINYSRNYSALASSLDGRTVVAAVSGGSIYVSSDYGSSWAVRDTSRAWSEVAISADGSTMAASVFNGSIFVSTNFGENWTSTSSGNAAWAGLAVSSDGNKLAAVAQSSALYLSPDRGSTWVAQSKAGLKNWSSIAMSADGSRLVASVDPGKLYTSSDNGLNWSERSVEATWSAVASSADGTNLVAAVNGGQIYTSSDAGVTWVNREPSHKWTSVATSTDGLRLVAVAANGQIGSSDDAGLTWLYRGDNLNWDDVICSSDGTRLVAVVSGGQIYTLNRSFASYTVDQTTGLVQDQNGQYLSTGVNTNLARVGRAFPLRLILHNQSAANNVDLLQHVYVGRGANTGNTIIANSEDLLDSTQLNSARRITATHLPFSKSNAPWSASGTFDLGRVLIFNVVESYKDQTSNPFLHTFHPDHDNLDVNFTQLLARGVESYDITRIIKLTFSLGGTNFASLTAAAQSRTGTYEETMAIGAEGSASRNFRLSGSYKLQLISPVTSLTKQ